MTTHLQQRVSLLLCSVVLSQAISLLAQAQTDLLDLEQRAFQAAVDVAAKHVVQIETFGGLERVGDELVADGPTTGTIIAPDGWIVSSFYSFRQKPASILVALPNGARVPAKIVARDYSREIALLKVEVEQELPYAAPSPQVSDQTSQLVGQWAIALGKTFDGENVSQSVGIVSAVGRAYGRALQTDAKISPVNYGGPLIDLTGQTLGILTPISPGAFLEGDSAQIYDSGIGFAIPLTDILERLPILQKGSDIHAGKLGIVTKDQNEMAGPVKIAGATPGSPAAKAGVKSGDILAEAQGKPIHLLAQLRHALGRVDAGQTFQFAVLRNGMRIELTCPLSAEIPVYRRRYLGLRLNESEDGRLLISGIEPDSPASNSSLTTQHRIVSCDSQTPISLESLHSQVALAELDVPLRFQTVDEAGVAAEVNLLATEWPKAIPETMPTPDKRIDNSMHCSIVDINLGDFPNKSFAIVPPLSDSRQLGLLIVFPEPGEMERDKTQSQWESFSRDQGWAIAVINSANPRSWSMEEIELAGRVIGRMQKSYKIDKARTAILGLGVGGRLALIAAGMQRERVSGVIAIGSDLNRLAVKQSNSPLQSLDYLLIGSPEQIESPAEKLDAQGFSVSLLPTLGVATEKWDQQYQRQFELWLEGLARL